MAAWVNGSTLEVLADLAASGGLMDLGNRGVIKEAQQPRWMPLDFAQSRLHYIWRLRRRKRWYGLLAALLILGVSTGVFAVFLTNWLSRTLPR